MAQSHSKERGLDRVVFGVSISIVAGFCLVGAIWPAWLGRYANLALDWIVGSAGWVFILASAAFVCFVLALAFSKYGRIPLSRDDEVPEFSSVSWVAMMFSAGMGIGLIFFGVFEPVSHLAHPAPWLDVEPGSPAAARLALGYTLFHWGLHPWGIYAVVALAMAYSTFRKQRGHLLSAPFQSLVHRNASQTWWGKGIDIWAIIATKFGGATSLGLGALQVAGGLWLLTGLGSGFETGGEAEAGGSQYFVDIVIVTLTFLAILSAVSGVSRGIKWLSNANMVVAALLALFVVVVGPTVLILDLIPEAFGAYLANVIPWSFRTSAFEGDAWMSRWTIFYWAWWISWTPFVGTFIARISKGRTIREFVIAVLLVPTAVSGVWFVVFGGAGMDLQMTGQAQIADAADEAVAFFTALDHFPFPAITGGVVVFLVAIFWVSGADASALVLATLSSKGDSEPKRWLIVLWAVMSAAVAAVLLHVGGLRAFQTFTILMASPFVLVMGALCWAVYADLRRDPLLQADSGPDVRRREPMREGVPAARP